MKPKLEPSWMGQVGQQFDAPYMKNLREFLLSEKQNGKTIYPPGSLWFEAFNRTPFDQVKVVILGQDPYHGPSQAHGLCFSVLPGVKLPPSLVNIFKEIHADLGVNMSGAGDLSHWANQGVLLLNATLTVEAHRAGSHQNKGWETFTDAAITALNQQRENVVFMLWGSYAQKKGSFVDQEKHLVLKAPHPSPLSAHRGFLGCKHFSQANQYLQSKRIAPVDWQL